MRISYKINIWIYTILQSILLVLNYGFNLNLPLEVIWFPTLVSFFPFMILLFIIIIPLTFTLIILIFFSPFILIYFIYKKYTDYKYNKKYKIDELDNDIFNNILEGGFFK